MERVHQLIAADNLNAEKDYFWIRNWPYITWAKVPLEKKVAAYNALRVRGLADINNVYFENLCEMIRADRAFVGELKLNTVAMHCYRLCTIWINDNVAELTAYYQKIAEDKTDHPSKIAFRRVVTRINPPCCLRFLLQDKRFRETVLRERMSPPVQQLAEELVQPTDHLHSESLLLYGQSVKLIGMCVSDEELVAAWLKLRERYPLKYRGNISVSFARKLHALATPDQCAQIKTGVLLAISSDGTEDSRFELAWLFGLLGPSFPAVQASFLRHNMSLFPAFTFAMIVALCDGYLELARGITTPQRRFFTVLERLPMDLQALVSLRLWGRTSTVTQSDQFNRALLAIF
jgi:hypothetical protein